MSTDHNNPHNHSHNHDHSQGHSHEHGHSHDLTSQPRKRLLMGFVLTTSFMLVEAVGGVISGSLALLADAGHMLTDSAALLLALVAISFSKKAADSKRSYGYQRLSVLAAYTNGIVLLLLTAWIVFEAVQRLINPAPVMSLPMLVVAILGLIVNIMVFFILHGASEESLNVRGAMLHVLGDLFGSVGAIVAALLIFQFNWTWADPVLSVFVSLLIIVSAWRLIKESSHILLQGAPGHIDREQVINELEKLEGVQDVHHMHLWNLDENSPMASLHAVIGDPTHVDAARDRIDQVLTAKFGIRHATIQVEMTCNNKEKFDGAHDSCNSPNHNHGDDHNHSHDHSHSH